MRAVVPRRTVFSNSFWNVLNTFFGLLTNDNDFHSHSLHRAVPSWGDWQLEWILLTSKYIFTWKFAFFCCCIYAELHSTNSKHYYYYHIILALLLFLWFQQQNKREIYSLFVASIYNIRMRKQMPLVIRSHVYYSIVGNKSAFLFASLH